MSFHSRTIGISNEDHDLVLRFRSGEDGIGQDIRLARVYPVRELPTPTVSPPRSHQQHSKKPTSLPQAQHQRPYKPMSSHSPPPSHLPPSDPLLEQQTHQQDTKRPAPPASHTIPPSSQARDKPGRTPCRRPVPAEHPWKYRARIRRRWARSEMAREWHKTRLCSEPMPGGSSRALSGGGGKGTVVGFSRCNRVVVAPVVHGLA